MVLLLCMHLLGPLPASGSVEAAAMLVLLQQGCVITPRSVVHALECCAGEMAA